MTTTISSRTSLKIHKMTQMKMIWMTSIPNQWSTTNLNPSRRYLKSKKSNDQILDNQQNHLLKFHQSNNSKWNKLDWKDLDWMKTVINIRTSQIGLISWLTRRRVLKLRSQSLWNQRPFIEWKNQKQVAITCSNQWLLVHFSQANN